MTAYGRMRRDLVEDGRLKIAINLGNAALARKDAGSGVLAGVTVALAKRLCETLSCDPHLVEFTGAGKVVGAADDGVWTIAFCAIDPAREAHVAFSPPYVLIEARAIVRAASALAHVDDLDREGVTLMVARGSAYDLFLSENARRLTLVREADPGASFEAFRRGEGGGEGGADAVAGVVQSLEKAFGEDPAYRWLDGTITAIGQAMVLPRRFAYLRDDLERFVEEAKADGFVRRELDRDGQHSLKVAPPLR